MTNEKEEKLAELKKESEYLKSEVARLSHLLARKGVENIRNQKRARDLIKDLQEEARAMEEKREEAQGQNEKLEKMNKLMVGREIKMDELKKEIKQLKNRLQKT